MSMMDRPRAQAGLLGFPRTIDDMFERFWGGPVEGRVTQVWQPPAEVVETENAFLVQLELPGVPASAVDVSLAGDTLTVRGEKKAVERAENDTVWADERRYGRFERTFQFHAPIAPDGVEAESRNGLLTIRVDKSSEAQPRKIEVKVG